MKVAHGEPSFHFSPSLGSVRGGVLPLLKKQIVFFAAILIQPLAVTCFVVHEDLLRRYVNTNSLVETATARLDASRLSAPPAKIRLSRKRRETKQQELVENDSFSKQANLAVPHAPKMLPGGITPKALAWSIAIVLVLAETLVDPGNFFNGREIGFNLVDAALPLTPTDAVAVTIGEVTAGAMAPFVTLAVVRSAPTTMSMTKLTRQAVADADFLVTRAAAQPFLTSLGLPSPLSRALGSLLALVPSEAVKTAARIRDEYEKQEMEAALLEEEQERNSRQFAFPNPFFKEEIVPDPTKMMYSPAIEFFSDLLKWLAYGVMCVKLASILAPLSHVQECAVFGMLANIGSQAYKDLMGKYFLDETERNRVESRSFQNWKSEYLSQAICGALLFGLYEGVQEPATDLISFLLDD